MHRLKIATVLSAAALLLLAVPATEAATQPFSAQFKNQQTRNDPPCPGAVFCGSGQVEGYGPATYSVVPTSIGPLVGACQAVTGLVNIALSDGSGTLTLAAAGDVCYPGNSHVAPGQLHAFGNPFRLDATFEVVGGTGVFAGAGGAGTATIRGAGAVTRLVASGTLDL